MAKRRSKLPVPNPELLAEILHVQEKRKEGDEHFFSDKLARMIIIMADNFALKNNWRNYTWNEEMKAEAIYVLCKNILKFDINKVKPGTKPNPFAYATQIMHRSFITTSDKEKRQGMIREEVYNMQNAHLPPEMGSKLDPTFNKQHEMWLASKTEEEKAAFGHKKPLRRKNKEE